MWNQYCVMTWKIANSLSNWMDILFVIVRLCLWYMCATSVEIYQFEGMLFSRSLITNTRGEKAANDWKHVGINLYARWRSSPPPAHSRIVFRIYAKLLHESWVARRFLGDKLSKLPEVSTINSLVNNLKQEWARIDPAILQHLTDDMPNRIREVINRSGDYIGRILLSMHIKPNRLKSDMLKRAAETFSDRLRDILNDTCRNHQSQHKMYCLKEECSKFHVCEKLQSNFPTSTWHWQSLLIHL